MKKYFNWLILLIILVLSTSTVNASTNTFERTEDDLKVPSKVVVTEYNKNAIISTPSVDAEEKVYDFADLFTEDEESKLYDEASEFIDKYNMDFAIVTINENNKSSEVSYADDFYDYNDFDNNGVLFLIDMDNRQIYMSTTGSAIKMYTDNRIDYLMDNVYKYMSDKEYYEGTSKYISLLSDLAEKGVPSSSSESFVSTGQIILYSLISSFIITLIVMIILVKKNKLVRKANEAKAYLVDDSVKIDVLEERLISTHTTKTKIEHESSGGGSSTHSGSSGISHGGGGHGF